MFLDSILKGKIGANLEVQYWRHVRFMYSKSIGPKHSPYSAGTAPRPHELSHGYYRILQYVPHSSNRDKACRNHSKPFKTIQNHMWLVVWIIFYFPRNIGFLIIPIDFHIFQRGGPTTNRHIKRWIAYLLNGDSTDEWLADCLSPGKQIGRRLENPHECRSFSELETAMYWIV